MDLTRQKSQLLFDSWAKTYLEDVFHGEGWGFERYREGHNWITDEILRFNPDKIIDLGCGPGITAFNLYRRGYSVDYVGVDFSKIMLSKVVENDPRCRYILSDIMDFPLWIEELNNEAKGVCISASYSLHHLVAEEQLRLIKHIFQTCPHQRVCILILDYAFRDRYHRDRTLTTLESSGQEEMLQEILSEHYLDVFELKRVLLDSGINVQSRQNGKWDWKIRIYN